MSEALVAYFAGEKAHGLVFSVLGGAGLAFAAVMAARGTPFGRGMAVSLAAVALVQLVVGVILFLRTDRQVGALQGLLARAPGAWREAELVRMERVTARFRLYKGLEIALVVGGVAVLLATEQPAWTGTALGFVVQGAIVLVLDVIAERRAERYEAAVQAFGNVA